MAVQEGTKLVIHCKYDELKNPKKLKPHPKNRNKHGQDQIERLAKIYEYQGIRHPIVVSNRSGFIVAGHGRRLAAMRSDIKEMPVVYQDFESDEQEYAFIQSDNAVALWAELDFSGINADIGDLGPDFDIDMLGIKNFVLEPADKEELGDPDAVPEKVKAKTKPGSIYSLGSHRLMCGSAINVTDVDLLMDGLKADMVFTDPPYNTGMKEKPDSTWLNHMFNDAFTDKEWEELLSGMCSSYFIATKETAALYVCLDWRRNHELVPHLKKHFELSNTIVWDKVVHGLGSDYKYTYELINVCKKGKPKINSHQGDDAEYSDVWHIQRKMGKDSDHATKKPIELVERALRHASKPNDLVIDFFGGSGSTLIACESLNRKCFMMELDPHYCDVIVARWEKYTGKKAELING